MENDIVLLSSALLHPQSVMWEINCRIHTDAIKRGLIPAEAMPVRRYFCQ